MNVLGFFRVFINLFQFNRTNWKAVTLCLTTALVFWLFNALNKTHTTNIKFPVRFEYDQQKYTPSEALPAQITLNVSGNGWDLFRKHFGMKVTSFIIPLEKPEARQLPGSSLISVLASQLSNLKINFVVTDSLRIHLDEKISRSFRLAPDLSAISYKKGYDRISPVVVLPDSIHLTGPKSLLRKMADSISLPLKEKRLSGNFREETEIVFPGYEFISRNPPVAEVMFEVGEMVEVKRWLKIKVEKSSWGTELVRDSVQVTLLVPQRDVENVSSLPIEVALRLGDLKKGETRKFRPIVTGYPAWTSVVYVDSVLVRRY